MTFSSCTYRLKFTRCFYSGNLLAHQSAPNDAFKKIVPDRFPGPQVILPVELLCIALPSYPSRFPKPGSRSGSSPRILSNISVIRQCSSSDGPGSGVTRRITTELSAQIASLASFLPVLFQTLIRNGGNRFSCPSDGIDDDRRLLPGSGPARRKIRDGSAAVSDRRGFTRPHPSRRFRQFGLDFAGSCILPGHRTCLPKIFPVDKYAGLLD